MTTCYREENDAVTSFTGWELCTNYKSSEGNYPCCLPNNICLEGSICYNPDIVGFTDASGYYMAICTDESYSDQSVCPQQCTDLNKGDIVYNNADDLWACCGQMANGTLSCNAPTNETFQAPSPQQLQAAASSLTAHSSSTASSTSMSSTLTTSPTTTTSVKPVSNATPSILSDGAKAGIGVGVALGVLLICGLLFWALSMRSRLRKIHNTKPAKADLPVEVDGQLVEKKSKGGKWMQELDSHADNSVHEMDGRT